MFEEPCFRRSKTRPSSRRAAISTLIWLGTSIAILAGPGCGRSEDSSLGPATSQAMRGSSQVEYEPHSVIVRFKEAAGLPAQRASALARVGGSFEDKDGDGVYDRFSNLGRSGRLMKLDLAHSISVEHALAELRKDPAVEYAEPNYRLRISSSPDDPRFSELYGLDNRGQSGGIADADIDAVEAWDTSTGSADIVVGVVDTGVDYDHEDLAANMWVNPGEIPGNDIDDDGNGVVDDVHGYNAITGSGDPMDDHSHGTHCAGTIGAVGGNSIGVTGVSWQVSLMALKFLGADGSGTLAEAIAAIDYALGMRSAGVNLRVLSNSWTGGGFSQALEDAIEEANQMDILFVAAAGNDYGRSNDLFPEYPASYESTNVVSVAATTHSDELAEFSSIGATSVDLGAPGEAILSTVPGDSYAFFNGTSMATPHVAGAAALVLSANRSLSTPELKDILLSSGDAKPALAGATLSGKRLNVANAIAAAGPPGPHFDLQISSRRATLAQEETGSYALVITDFAGFEGDVTLSVSSVPPMNAELTVAPAVVHTRGTAALQVQTSVATSPGDYRLTLTATSGSFERTVHVSLRVLPAGAIEESYSSADTPIPFTDLQPATSTISVDRSFAIHAVQVEVHLTHPDSGDLQVALISPSGTEVMLHDLDFYNPSRRYGIPSQLAGELSAGAWKLRITDVFGDYEEELGELLRWSLHLSNQPSQATFTVSMREQEKWIAQHSGHSPMLIDVGAIAGFSGFVSLRVSSTPAFNGSLHVNSPSRPPSTATLSVDTTCDTAPGTYDLTISASSGGVTKTTTAKLTILPGSSTLVQTDSPDAPRRIPDHSPEGTTSTMSTGGWFPISMLQIDVEITHPSIGELTVKLISLTGTEVMLHDRTGGDEDNLRRTYDVPQFVGAEGLGLWKLQVVDHVAGGTGRLDRWRLSAADTRLAPSSSFDFNRSFLSVEMFNSSADIVGCGAGFLTGWHWDFGDGTTSTEWSPTHVYAEEGTYPVTLTVTDNDGNIDAQTQEVEVTRAPLLAIERISRNRATSQVSVNLSWSRAEGSHVELHRNNMLIDVTRNDGAYRDTFRSSENSYIWKICQVAVAGCSNHVSVVFGNALDASSDPGEATVTITGAGGATTTKVLRIEAE
jgi:serine protease